VPRKQIAARRRRALQPGPEVRYIREPMDQLATEFRQRLSERIDALAAARATLGHDAAARALVRNIAHALKGSGGTYGYPEISAAAGGVESAPDGELPGRLDALLAVLRREAATTPPAAAAAVSSLGAALQAPLDALRESIRAPLMPPSGAPTALLVVDDDPDIAKLLAQVLAAPDREIEIAGTAAAAQEAVARRSFGLIVLDLVLPDADGRALLTRLRERPDTSTVPIVVLSALRSGPARAECFALGADAYVEKPFDLGVVADTASAMLERAARVAREAGIDPLTLLPNRVAFREAFEHATTHRADRRAPVSLALLELDQYRAMATSSGWGTADRARALAAASLARALGRATIVAHWAGATFAALLVGASEADAAARVAEALRRLQSEKRAPDRHDAPFTFSAGVVEWSEGTSLDETVAEAERHVVTARAAGGNTTLSSAQPGTSPARVVALAEDDELIAAVVKHRLEREGITVKHFTDGVAARDAIPRLRPALAILDVKMPGMDGFELLSRLRAEPALAGLPIMMLTSMGNEQDVVRGLQLGADDYVVKPFSPVELVARVHRLLIRR
jgi:diguanylate cyclase (GGDEF)-like protein